MKNGLEGLEESVLPLVAKPGRYVAPPGLRASADFESARLRICVLYPEPLESAAAAPLLQSVMARLRYLTGAGRPSGAIHYDVAAVPEADLLALLSEQGLPPFSLAYRRSLSQFDVVLVLAGSILSVSRALRLVSLCGIPFSGADRTSRDPLILLAGDAVWYPETLAAQIDAFLLGDPEAWMEDVLASLGRQDRAHTERREALFRLSEIEGILVPVFPSAGRPGGRWLSHLGSVADGGVTPLIETCAEAAVIEIARPIGPVCAVSAPRQFRFRPVEDTLRGAAMLLERTGEDVLVLAGEGAARHPALGSMLEALNLRFAPDGLQVRMDAVDPGCFTSAVARELQKARRADLHFVPVPVSERLRDLAGRPLPRTALESSVAMALRGEWSGVRLSFVLGLPGETAEDHNEGMEVLEQLVSSRAKASKRLHLGVELKPFVPVRHTLWEDHPGLSSQEWPDVVARWRHRLGRSKIRVIAPHAAAAEAETALRLGGVTAGVFLPEIGTWWEGLPSDPEGAEVVLARKWSELKPRLAEQVDSPTYSLTLTGDSPQVPSESEVEPHTEPAAPVSRLAGEEGRRPRREGRGRDVRQSDRFRLRAVKDERVRFISHLDVARAFFRAFRRSRLPVAITGGKDRRQKIAFGPPLPLGMTSGAEFLDVAFVREVPELFVPSLNESLPEGLSIVAWAPMRTEPDSLSSVIQIATYEVSFPDAFIRRYLSGMPFEELRARLEDRVASVTASPHVEITKGRGSDRKTFNARPSMLRAEVVRDDGGRPVLSLALTLNRPDSARPELWTAALLDWAHVDERLLRVHRSGLYIPGRQSWLDPLDVVAPGFEWWRQPVRGGTVS